MRIFNRAQLGRVPMVDAGNLYLGEISETVEARRVRLQQQNAQKLAQLRASQVRAQKAAQAEYARRIQAAQSHADMLARSLRNSGHQVVAAARLQGMGWVPQYGVKNPTLGFVDETVGPNFNIEDAVPAQEFSNRLTNHDSKWYTKFQDFPLVIDAPRGDFSGVLTTEAESADFSTRIVNDVPQDFGYIPRPRAKLRRR